MTVEVKLCPRCGQQYKYVETRRIKEQTYYYALHISFDENHKKHVHKCYLGAHTYKYVKTVHMDSKIEFHGYTYVNRYKEYARDLSDYLNRDKQKNKPKPRVKTNPQADIDLFVKKLYSQAKWQVSIVALNALYNKYLKYAVDMGIKPEKFSDIFAELDPKMTYSELEQCIDMWLRGSEAWRMGNSNV